MEMRNDRENEIGDRPPYSPGDLVFIIMDGHFAKVVECKRAPGAIEWHCELRVDGKKIGTRLCRELERVKLKVAAIDGVSFA